MGREAQENGFRQGGQRESNALLLQNHRVAFIKPTRCFLETNALVSGREAEASLFPYATLAHIVTI